MKNTRKNDLCIDNVSNVSLVGGGLAELFCLADLSGYRYCFSLPCFAGFSGDYYYLIYAFVEGHWTSVTYSFCFVGVSSQTLYLSCS